MYKYLKKYVGFMILAPLFMFGEVLMDLLQPQLMKTIVDDGVLGLNNNNVGDVSLVISVGLKMIGLVLIGCLCGILSGVFANLCSQNFSNDVRKVAFKKIMSFSFDETGKFTTGSLITRVTNDITQVQQFVTQAIRGFVRTFLLFAGGIVCMLTLNMSFGAVVACALPLVIICVIYFITKANPMFSVLQKKLDGVNNVMQENVSGARIVKACVKEEYETRRFNAANDELVNKQLDVLLLFSYMTPLMNIVMNVSIVAIIKVGAIEVGKGSISPGTVMAAITYITQILNAVMRMTMIFQTASRGIASQKRIEEILNTETTIADGDFDGETKVKGKIEFKNVSFRYPLMGDRYVLKDINLTINPGETVGILGATGCGKSSLVNLIPRFYDANEGEVLVDDVNVKDYKLHALRDKIAIALQKSEIFADSIKGNILWGQPDADENEIDDAANIAQAMEFIKTRPDGMDTHVEQGGNSLSGGQKQRLSISRAILKNSEIMIFDDATSALDLKTEANLYRALKDKSSDATRIIIAQRIASVKDVDRILVIDDGVIVADGNHKSLMEESPIYRDIYDSQLKGVSDNPDLAKEGGVHNG